MNLHTHIKSQQKETKVQTYTCTPVSSNAFTKQVKSEYRIVGISEVAASKSPDVTGINKHSRVHHHKEVRTELNAHIELYITRLVDEINIPIAILVTSRAKRAHSPSAQAICTTGEITFLKRKPR